MKNKKISKVEKLLAMRHTAEHVLTQAMIRLYPGLKMAMGPATDDGFYFDFDYKKKISEADFPKIESEMQKIVDEDLFLKKEKLSVKKAREMFKDNKYKQEWLDEIESKEEKAIVYWTADQFVDLCAGPHVKSTGKIGAFKLLSVAGAYWRGDEKNKMLTRIYGTAFSTKKELDENLKLREEAKKRDHKILGKELDLYTFSNLVGPGLPLWTPKGTVLRNLLDDFVWELRRARGYQKVEIPHITKKELYIISGHWDKFKNDLFRIRSREGWDSALKPMNCPHHTQIYARKPHSYKELPQRYANTTMVYRDEQSGELSGLVRVESITQDDAHVFCRKSQIKEEFLLIWDIVDEFYGATGFDVNVRLSLHDPENKDAFLGDLKDWNTAENVLRKIAKGRGVKFYEDIGEAAFYGPKIDFMALDSLNREWQVATIQLDMNMPERFGLYCINESGEKEGIVMIHAAIMGAIERYISILIEHFAGAFPVWLSPVQVKVLPITQRNIGYAKKVLNKLEQDNIRVELDDRNETLQAKIRSAQLEKVPYMIVLGDKEEKLKKVAVRLRTEKDLGQMSLENFRKRIIKKIDDKSLSI